MAIIKTIHNGIELGGQYTIVPDKRQVVIEMRSPYPGITYAHVVLQRDFDRYIERNGDEIATAWLIRMFEAVNIIKAHIDLYSSYVENTIAFVLISTNSVTASRNCWMKIWLSLEKVTI